MRLRACLIAGGSALLALAAATPARADRCTINIGNGTADELVEVTVRAVFAPPATEADEDVPVAIGGKLSKNQSVKVEWNCPTNSISYAATGTFANGIKRRSAPFTPRPAFSGALDTAWIQ